MSTASGMLFVHALTGLHPGSGTALGVVDLPVQRERHTHWPIIPGSSMKGVLRSAYTGGEEATKLLFGPDTRNASDHAGALTITDARVLAFPVRSMAGVFVWVTCPAVLARLVRDAAAAGVTGFPPVPGNPAKGQIHPANKDRTFLVDADTAIFEEFDFRCTTTSAKEWAAKIAKLSNGDAATQNQMTSHFAILNDDDFTHFVQFATEVVQRIALDSETKTVRDGGLFSEEVLPAETVFYALAIANDSRNRDAKRTGDELLASLKSTLDQRPYLQFGAGETIGRGLCAVRLEGGAK